MIRVVPRKTDKHLKYRKKYDKNKNDLIVSSIQTVYLRPIATDSHFINCIRKFRNLKVSDEKFT